MHNPNVQNLLALATDVLAQSEARQRAARRLHAAVAQMSETFRQTGGAGALETQRVRDHARAVRELEDAERNLLDEFDAALSQR